MKRVVISQPMYFPWVGLFEQIRLADEYVHYDDVQFSKGSFVNRVQVKTAAGSKWLTVPLRGLKLGQAIRDVSIDDATDWRQSQAALLRQAYTTAPYRDDMLGLVERVHAGPAKTIGELSIASMAAVCDYYAIGRMTRFHSAADLEVGGSSSDRVLGIVLKLEGDVYVTGHGAWNYLDHELFEDRGVRVEYLAYAKKPYPQLHGTFTPYVSTLDLIANAGPAGADAFCSGTVSWKEFHSS